MKKYKTSDTLTEGDIVEYGLYDELYKAVRFDRAKPCMQQCDMAGAKWHVHCAGFCYRWENGDNFVFAKADVDPKSVTIMQTTLSKIDGEK